MFDVPSVGTKVTVLYGNIGTVLQHLCLKYGYVIIIGVSGLVTRHEGCRDCDACKRMQDLYGTCEYVGETERCECKLRRYRENLGKRRKSVQTYLQTDSTAWTRYRYWLDYLDQQRQEIEEESSK